MKHRIEYLLALTIRRRLMVRSFAWATVIWLITWWTGFSIHNALLTLLSSIILLGCAAGLFAGVTWLDARCSALVEQIGDCDVGDGFCAVVQAFPYLGSKAKAIATKRLVEWSVLIQVREEVNQRPCMRRYITLVLADSADWTSTCFSPELSIALLSMLEMFGTRADADAVQPIAQRKAIRDVEMSVRDAARRCISAIAIRVEHARNRETLMQPAQVPKDGPKNLVRPAGSSADEVPSTLLRPDSDINRTNNS